MTDPSFLDLFGPQPIYAAGQSLAVTLYATVTPVLLVIAVSLRTLETQLDLLAGQGQFTKAVRDFFLYGIAISVYFGLMSLIAGFMNPFYHWLDSFGSLQAIAKEYSLLTDSIKQHGANDSALNQLTSITVSPSVWMAEFICYITFILLRALTAFLRIAHAIGYSFVVIYGLIALPLSITTRLRLLRGWALFLGFLLLWPVVEAICVGLFSQVFSQASSLMATLPDQSAGMSTFDTNVFYALLNIILMCVLVSSAWVAGYLVINTSPHSGLLAPFVAGAVAAGSVISAKVSGVTGGGGGGSMFSKVGSGSGIVREIRSRLTSGGAASVPSASAPSASSSSMEGGGISHAAAMPPQTNNAEQSPSDASRARRQQRRGAIINQRRSKPE